MELHLLHEIIVRVNFDNIWKTCNRVIVNCGYFVNGKYKDNTNFKSLMINLPDNSSLVNIFDFFLSKWKHLSED